MLVESPRRSRISTICVLTWSGWKRTEPEGEREREIESQRGGLLEKHGKHTNTLSFKRNDFFINKQLPFDCYKVLFYTKRKTGSVGQKSLRGGWFSWLVLASFDFHLAGGWDKKYLPMMFCRRVYCAVVVTWRDSASVGWCLFVNASCLLHDSHSREVMERLWSLDDGRQLSFLISYGHMAITVFIHRFMDCWMFSQCSNFLGESTVESRIYQRLAMTWRQVEDL